VVTNDVTQQSGATALRRLVPRIFSRGPSPGAVDQLVRTVRGNYPRADLSVIERAYTVAERAHRGQKRRSGEPYITHPIAVAQILAELGVAPVAIAAALLHDTVEDTEYTLEQLTEEFGDEIAMLVDGVTKLDKVKYGDSAQAETVRKMVVAMSKDIRVLVIKLADRLHNARTWGFVPGDSAKRKAQETIEIYAPLAHRLGIQSLKAELEDLSFAVLKPKLYAEIENLVTQRNPQRDELVGRVISSIDNDLREAKIRGEVTGRRNSIRSIRRWWCAAEISTTSTTSSASACS
jgi:GTP pyrophosphokinase